MTTDLNLDAIEARANAALNSPTGQSYDAGVILSRDVPALVAEVRRLRERNERLKQANDAEHARLVAARDRMRAERDDARAEADRLTGALGAIAALPSASKPVRDIARDALLDVRHDPSATTDGGSDD